MSPPGPDSPELHGGFTKLVGLRFEEVSGDRVVLRCPVTGDLHQPYGLVHGGVHATLAETAASVGGALWFGDRGKVTFHHHDVVGARPGVHEGGRVALELAHLDPGR